MEDTEQRSTVTEICDRIRAHEFHPVDESSFTVDRTLGEHGIAALDDNDWRVRLLAVRDLVRSGNVDAIAGELHADDVQVQYVCATALGVLRAAGAIDALEEVVRTDPNPLARAPAVVALGQLGAKESLSLLEECREHDDSRDVRHRAELAIDRIQKEAVAEPELETAYRNLDPEAFGQLTVGEAAPSFELPDTEGNSWTLEALRDGWTVLLWVFADWCPVCHREFDELIEHRETLADANVTVATIECHDRYRARVMAGRELEPDYWFADESGGEHWQDEIWWPHLVDRAGSVGATYGVDPLAYAVHAEYINRPATIVIDPSGIVRFAYYGTFWGDRPSIEDIVDLIRSEHFAFAHPDRLAVPSE